MPADLFPVILVVHPHAIDEHVTAAWQAQCTTKVCWQHVQAAHLVDAWSVVAALDVPRVLLRADCQLGFRALDRLLGALTVAGDDAVLLPLDNASSERLPLLSGAAPAQLDLQQFDAACRLLAEPLLLPCAATATAVCLAAGAAVRKLESAGWLLDCQQFVAVPDGLRTASALPVDVRERPPEPLWADLATRLAGLPANFAAAQIGLDDKPVVLHLLHGWGGGAQRWVLDLAAVDTARHHLLLRAFSSATRKQHGERLQLLDARRPDVVLREVQLTPAIANLDPAHLHYRTVLDRWIAEFSVTSLWISSLIGHALDALDVACDLRWVAHDYFPFWPVLHVDFGDTQSRFDEAQLRLDLAADGNGAMRTEAAELWTGRRDRVLATLLQRQVAMITPDVSVRANLQRMCPSLAQLPWHIIAHGVDMAAPNQHLVQAPAGGRLRVLVPGRIQGGKGLSLLQPALDRLLAHCDLYLLGCGAAGMALFGRSGVHVELDFEHAELPALLARIQPDLALLPRSVAETFSYVLSEMWALGVPVLGTRLGSLASRITPGVDGWLCEAEPQALVAALAALAEHPQQIHEVAQLLRQRPVRSRQQMLLDYAALLPTRAIAWSARVHLASVVDVAALQQAAAASRLGLDLHAAELRARSAETEILRRGDWGQSLSRLVEERTRWAQSLETQLLTERAVAAALADDHAHYTEQMAQSQSRVAELEQQQLDARQQLELAQHEQRVLAEQLQYTDECLKRAETDLANERRRVADFIASSSWRMTAPFRVLIRQLRGVRESLAYRVRSLRQLARRGMTSLRQRGFAATLQRLKRGAPTAPALTIETQPMSTPEQRFEPFALPRHGAPVVSIIIPVYNKFGYTEACLRSLARVVDATAFEVIVIDDGSSDETWANLQKIDGILAHRNVENLGFIGACNKGAELASGDYVFFLNNDTQVQDGFLLELLKVFVSHPDAGLVGSKLIYPDGRLQECGGIIFSDGSGWNYGRFDDPQHAHYGYVREVDYVSGAAIVLRRDLFNSLGRFDTLYAPAYYEDTDLAFKVRAHAQLKVYVAPASRVVHFEGVTSGTDLGSGIKRYQVLNQAKFLERWATQLAQHPAPGTSILKARQHRVRRRVLVIDACTPMPDQDSGSLRMYNLLRLLLEDGAAVSFFNEDRAYHAGYAEALQNLGVEMLFHPWLSDVPGFFRERGGEFDLVILSRHYVAERFLPLVRDHAPQAKLWFDTVDLHYLRERRAAQLNDDPAGLKAAAHTQAQECALMQRCDITLVVSAVEQQLLAVDCPSARVEILSNIHDIPGRSQGPAARRDICFVGGFQHPPNVDAVLWFAHEVWPLIRAKAPELVLHLIGSRTPPEIAGLASAHIHVHGFVADLEPFMAGCRLSVAPLRYGAGVKGKVNMSMSYGLPVVATSVALEGMFLESGIDALIADTPVAFADAVLQLCGDDALWSRLSDASLANVQRHFSLDAARQVLGRLLSS
jgi:GT2 family glycosyltransferase